MRILWSGFKSSKTIFLAILVLLISNLVAFGFESYLELSPVSSSGSKQPKSLQDFAFIFLVEWVFVLPFLLLRKQKKVSYLHFVEISAVLVVVKLACMLLVFLLGIAVFDTNLHIWSILVSLFLSFLIWFRKGMPYSRQNRMGEYAYIFTLFLLAGILSVTIVVLGRAYKKNPSVMEWVNNIQSYVHKSNTHYELVPYFQKELFVQAIDFDIDSKTDDFYVLERRGFLKKVVDGVVQAEVDFRSEVGSNVRDENGAYSLILHKAFSTTQKLYIYHTARGSMGNYNQLVELNMALPDSLIWKQKRVVLKFETKSPIHQGGGLTYDSEGFLMLGIGENSKSEYAQNPVSNLYGVVIRIDPDKAGDSLSFSPGKNIDSNYYRDYYIPYNNPFVHENEIAEEVWSYGLRNPFRMSWDNTSQQLILGDVGEWSWEELNLLKPRDNSGWPHYEHTAKHTNGEKLNKGSTTYKEAFFAYEHTARDRSIVSGFVYQGNQHTSLENKIILGDNCSGAIWSLDMQSKKRLPITQAPDFNQSGLTKLTNYRGDILAAVMGSHSRETYGVYKLMLSNENSDKKEKSESVQEIFQTNCTTCHNHNGDGKTEFTASLNIIMPNFSSSVWRDTVDEKYLFEIIRNGGESKGRNQAMPAWKGAIEDKNIHQLVKYLKYGKEVND